MVIPAQPDHIKDIDTTGVFFCLGGENITRFDVDVHGDQNRRLLGFTSNKVFEAGVRMARSGVISLGG